MDYEGNVYRVQQRVRCRLLPTEDRLNLWVDLGGIGAMLVAGAPEYYPVCVELAASQSSSALYIGADGKTTIERNNIRDKFIAEMLGWDAMAQCDEGSKRRGSIRAAILLVMRAVQLHVPPGDSSTDEELDNVLLERMAKWFIRDGVDCLRKSDLIYVEDVRQFAFSPGLAAVSPRHLIDALKIVFGDY